MKMKYKHYSIYLNEIESNKKLLSFRCNETNILIWPILRSNFLNLLQSKLFYKEWLNYEKNDSIIIKIIRKLVKLFYLFTNINFYKNLIFKIGKNKILFVKSGYGNIKRKDIIFDRNIDPYLIFATTFVFFTSLFVKSFLLSIGIWPSPGGPDIQPIYPLGPGLSSPW